MCIRDRYRAQRGSIWPTTTAPVVGEDTETSFYAGLPTRNFYVSSADTTNSFDCREVQTTFTGLGRLYVGVKITTSPTYRNDLPIGGFQILSSDKSTVEASWIFHSSSGGSGSGWQTYTSQISGSSTAGFPVTPATAAGYTYSSISTSTSTGKFTWASSTSSSYTGAANGISNTSWTTTPMTIGNNAIPQAASKYYAYREASGSTQYSGTIMRSPSRAWSGGEWIRGAFLLTCPTSAPMTYGDSLFVGTY